MLAGALEELNDPPVEFLYISRSNPLTQVGDSNRLRLAMREVSFIVTAEHFMTDTAAISDLVLPATDFLEAEDLFFNSMSHQYLVYGEQICEPPGECRPEYEFFGKLAARLGVGGYPSDPEPEILIDKAIRPLREATGITLQQIKENGPLLLPGADDVPWRERVFETNDGKFNFYSPAAGADGAGPLPDYREPIELADPKIKEAGYRYWFVTPHQRESIHSTHLLPGSGLEPKAYIHLQTAEREKLINGDPVCISSKRGRIELPVEISDRVPTDTVVVYQGWWHKSGAAVNNLTADRLTDFGNQAAYYDCLCKIEKI
jgi:anaerobic selenocysteine-containing dehydrogenase